MKRLVFTVAILLPLLTGAQQVLCGNNSGNWYSPASLSWDPGLNRIAEDSTTILRIPVVVHILHVKNPIGSPQNPTEAQIRETLDYLNQSFRATWSFYPDTIQGGIDTRIEFVLANRDTAGRVFNGIDRIDATGYPEYVQFGRVGPTPNLLLKYTWNRFRYFNIWILHRMEGVSGGFGIPPQPVNGPILNAEGFGVLYSIFKPGDPVLPHEAGHYLGLDHTWGIAFGNTCPANINCEADGDMICDTEPHSEKASCHLIGTINPCTGLPYGNTLKNFMSYSASPCRDRFTRLQKKRMRLTMLSLRPGIANNDLTVQSVVALKELNEFKVLPNPNNGTFTIHFIAPVSGELTVSILNSSGQLVFRKMMEANMVRELPVSVSGLQRGIYFISLRDKSGILTNRIFIR